MTVTSFVLSAGSIVGLCFLFLAMVPLQQPVHVSDVAWSVVQSLSEPATINREFNVPGASALAYNDIIRITAHALGRRVHCLHIPSEPVVRALQLLERLGTNLPIKAEQVLRLNEDKVFSFSAAEEIFNYRPMSFDKVFATRFPYIALQRMVTGLDLCFSFYFFL